VGKKDVATAWKTYQNALHQQLENTLQTHQVTNVPRDYLIQSIHNHENEVTLNTHEARQQTIKELKEKLTIAAPIQTEQPDGKSWPVRIKLLA
jgi:hypothetical protein